MFQLLFASFKLIVALFVYCRRRQLLRAMSGMPGAGAVRHSLRLGPHGGVRRHVHRRPHHRQRQEPGAPRAGPELVSITISKQLQPNIQKVKIVKNPSLFLHQLLN